METKDNKREYTLLDVIAIIDLLNGGGWSEIEEFKFLYNFVRLNNGDDIHATDVISTLNNVDDVERQLNSRVKVLKEWSDEVWNHEDEEEFDD